MDRPSETKHKQASKGSSGGGTHRIQSAALYRNPGDLCVILCIFNVGKSQEKIRNFNFCRSLFQKSGIPLIIVDCAFGDDPWVAEPSAEVIHLRTSTALWQKERLINCGLTRVPDGCTKVAWIDADVVFQNSDWAVNASELLDDLPVVQLADRFVRLPRGSEVYDGVGEVWESFGAIYVQHPNAMLLGDFAAHGHTGFGWAARRSMLGPAGLYEACVAGGGDHIMAHLLCGDWESLCLTRTMGTDSLWYHHAIAWAKKVYPRVRARLGFVHGAALHLWHGDISSRRHMRRYEALHNAGFDPDYDLTTDEGGCLQWASDKPLLRSALEDYLIGRRFEAGDA